MFISKVPDYIRRNKLDIVDKIKNMTILVTGGCGFIGSHIATNLIDLGSNVIVLDNLITGKKENIDHLINHERFQFVLGDIRDLETCIKVTKGIDLVCHQAALGSVPRSLDDPLTSHNVNINGFLNILLACKENNVRRMTYASSSSVYGDNSDEEKLEERTGKLLSPYALTKAVNELYGHIFNKCFDIECIGLRYFNVFGPRQDPYSQYSAVIPKFLNYIITGKDLPVFGDGEQSRDFTFIDNVVLGNILALTTENKELFGSIVNVAGSNPVSVNKMIETIRKYKPFENTVVYLPPRKGDILHSNANTDKVVRTLEFETLVPFEEGMESTIKYFENVLK